MVCDEANGADAAVVVRFAEQIMESNNAEEEAGVRQCMWMKCELQVYEPPPGSCSLVIVPFLTRTLRTALPQAMCCQLSAM